MMKKKLLTFMLVFGLVSAFCIPAWAGWISVASAVISNSSGNAFADGQPTGNLLGGKYEVGLKLVVTGGAGNSASSLDTIKFAISTNDSENSTISVSEIAADMAATSEENQSFTSTEFTFKATKAGTYKVKAVPETNALYSTASELTIKVTEPDPVDFNFNSKKVTGQSTSLTPTESDYWKAGTEDTTGKQILMSGGTDDGTTQAVSNIEITNLTQAIAEVAKSGLTLEQDTSDATGKTYKISGTPSKIGEYSFTMKARDSKTNDKAEATFTYVVKGVAPYIVLMGDSSSAAANTPANDTGETTKDIGTAYDSTNSAIFTGVNFAYNQTGAGQVTKGDGDKSTVGIYVNGSTEDLKVDYSIDPLGSGLSFDLGTGTPDTTSLTTYYVGKLYGVAQKAGTYKLTITVSNAETARSGKTVSKTYKFTVKNSPYITTPTDAETTVAWGKEFTLNLKASDAGSFTIINDDTDAAVFADTKGIPIDYNGKTWSVGSHKEAFTASGGAAGGTDGSNGLVLYEDGTKHKDLKDLVNLTTTESATGITLNGTWKPSGNPKNNDYLVKAAKDPSDVSFYVVAFSDSASNAAKPYAWKKVTLHLKSEAPKLTIMSKADTTFEYDTGYDNDKADGSGTASVAIAEAEGAGIIEWWPLANSSAPTETTEKDVAELKAINDALPFGLKVDVIRTYNSQMAEANKGATKSTLYVRGKPAYITAASGVSVPLTPFNVTDAANVSTTTIGTSETKEAKVTVVATNTTAPDLKTSTGYNVLPEGYVAKGKTAFGDGSPAGIDTSFGADTPEYYDTETSQYEKIHKDGDSNTAGVLVALDDDARKPAAPTSDPEVELFAEPGPVVWKAENLPTGVILVPDQTDSRFAYLQFSSATEGFKEGTKITKNGKDYESIYKITLSNPYLSKSTTLEGNLVVWSEPKVVTKSLPSLTIGKAWTPKLEFSGTPSDYVVKFVATGADADTTDASSIAATDYNGPWKPAPSETGALGKSAGELEIDFDKDTLQFKGTLDRIPQIEGKNKFRVYVKPVNFYTENTSNTLEDAKVFDVAVTGVAPSFANAGAITLEDGGSYKFEMAKGTPDFKIGAFIPAATLNSTKLDSSATSDAELGTTEKYGLKFTDHGDGTASLSYTGGSEYAFKGLAVTLSADNNQQKGVQKSFKISVEGDDPIWGSSNSDEEVNVLAGKAIDDKTYTATVTKPFEIKTSPAAGVDKNGLKVTIEDDAAGDKKVVKISGAPLSGKETKTAFTLTATNTSTKQKAVKKITVVGVAAPQITSTASKLDKEVELGKKVSIKPAAKGSKGMKWRTAADSETSSAQLEEYGLTLDPDKGAITGVASALTTTSTTPKEYETKNVTLEAYNDDIEEYGPDGTGTNKDSLTWPTVTFKFGVKGEKPKITTKNITLKRNETDRGEIFIETTPKYDAENVVMAFDGTMPDGIAMDSQTGKLTLTDSGFVATKGTNKDITINNAGSEAKGKVKFIINDDKPEIEDTTIDDISALAKAKVTKTFKINVTDESCTGDTQITWAIKTAPKRSTAKIKADNSTGKKATLTITVPKGLTNTGDADIDETIGIVATNKRTKEASDEKKFTFSISPVTTALPEDTVAVVKDYEGTTAVALPETSKRKSSGEGDVKLGTTRTVAGLTAGENTIVHEEGYIIAAVLPEVTVTEDGQYDLNVELAETVAEGAELKYFAFPRNAEASEDDEICDFYDDEGKDVEAVPASHKITVAPWFNADVTYAPVIAVKADTGAEGAKTVEEIEEVVADAE